MTSAELITALQAARPAAADTLRDRVRSIAPQRVDAVLMVMAEPAMTVP